MPNLERLGPYRIVGLLGTGGMGSVYRAVDEETGRVVAVKVLHPHLADDAELLTRFEREARIASELRSPYIVATLGYSRRPPYIVMEFVDGEPLSALLRRNGPMPVGDWLRLISQVTEGLAAAHTAGVIHRDVSPHNILVTREMVAKLSDFGIARATGATVMTGTASFLGKPAYAAPEVFAGIYDARSDVYALGVTMYEAIAGEPAFRGTTPMALMKAHQESSPPPLERLRKDLPPAMAAIVARCLQKAPEDRYQNAAALMVDLQLVSAYPQLPPEQLMAPRMPRTRRTPPHTLPRLPAHHVLWIAVPALASVIIAAAAIAWMAAGREPNARGAQANPSPATTAFNSPALQAAGASASPEATGTPPVAIVQPAWPDRSVIEQAVRNSNDVYIAAFRNLDEQLLSTVYADDALQYYQNQLQNLKAQGTPEYDENTQFRVDSFSARDVDRAHIETYEAWTWSRPGAATVREEYTEQYNLERRNGRWLITCNSFQSTISDRKTVTLCS